MSGFVLQQKKYYIYKDLIILGKSDQSNFSNSEYDVN